MTDEDLTRRFELAVRWIGSAKGESPVKTSNTQLLFFYGRYKRAAVGKCHIPKPSIWSIQARAKWNAWNSTGKLSKVQAQREYVVELMKLARSINLSNLSSKQRKDLQQFLREMEPQPETEPETDQPTAELKADKQHNLHDVPVSNGDSNILNAQEPSQASAMTNGMNVRYDVVTQPYRDNDNDSGVQILLFDPTVASVSAPEQSLSVTPPSPTTPTATPPSPTTPSATPSSTPPTTPKLIPVIPSPSPAASDHSQLQNGALLLSERIELEKKTREIALPDTFAERLEMLKIIQSSNESSNLFMFKSILCDGLLMPDVSVLLL